MMMANMEWQVIPAKNKANRHHGYIQMATIHRLLITVHIKQNGEAKQTHPNG